MNLDAEYSESLQFVANVNWTSTETPSKTFETCIRYLGGLLSAYDLRPNPMLLTKALELVDQVLLPAFTTKNHIPASFVDVARLVLSRYKVICSLNTSDISLENVLFLLIQLFLQNLLCSLNLFV